MPKIDNDVVRKEGNTLYLKGPFIKANVMQLWNKVKSTLTSGETLRVDLGNITQCDSAGLAFLIVLLRFARQQSLQVSFVKMPAQMQRMVKVNGLSALLPISEG